MNRLLTKIQVRGTHDPHIRVAWIPGWGGTAHGLLPVLENCDWGTHCLLNPPELSQLQSEHELTIGELADFVHSTLNEPWHIVGISMGGIIAQCLALYHAKKVLSLHLCCTNTGGYQNPYGVNPAVQKIWFSKATDLEDPVLKILSPCFSLEAQKNGLLNKYAEHIRATPIQPSGRLLKLQWQAMTKFGSQDLVKNLQMPLHLYYGLMDQVVGYHDYSRLRGLLPLATTQEFNGGHMFFLESAPSFLKVLRQRILSGLQ
jgi:pimeloyl-ACP methyl ester carboxylesterase